MLIPDPWARVSVSKYFCGDAKLHLEHQDAVDAVFNKARDSAVGRELCDRDHGQAGESLLGMTFSFTIAASWQNLGQHCRRSKERLWWLWSKSEKHFDNIFFIYIIIHLSSIKEVTVICFQSNEDLPHQILRSCKKPGSETSGLSVDWMLFGLWYTLWLHHGRYCRKDCQHELLESS